MKVGTLWLGNDKNNALAKIFLLVLVNNNDYSGCEVTVRHRRYPTNLAQRPIEKQFLLLNVQTISVENFFVVKPY